MKKINGLDLAIGVSVIIFVGMVGRIFLKYTASKGSISNDFHSAELSSKKNESIVFARSGETSNLSESKNFPDSKSQILTEALKELDSLENGKTESGAPAFYKLTNKDDYELKGVNLIPKKPYSSEKLMKIYPKDVAIEVRQVNYSFKDMLSRYERGEKFNIIGMDGKEIEIQPTAAVRTGTGAYVLKGLNMVSDSNIPKTMREVEFVFSEGRFIGGFAFIEGNRYDFHSLGSFVTMIRMNPNLRVD